MIFFHIIRRLLSIMLLVFASLELQAQEVNLRDVFRQMPDSILPYLTETNRLDMMDFMDSHMKARVQNKFEGYSEMLALSDDSLTIQMSSMLRLTLRLVPVMDEIDGSRQLICLERIVGKTAEIVHTTRTFYSVLWRKLEEETWTLVK